MNSLQSLLKRVHVKTIHQRNVCNENKEKETYPNKHAHDETKLTNGVNSSDMSFHSSADSSSISGDNIDIKVDPCPLRFDTLVDYFETRESNGQHARNISGVINQNKVFNAKNGELL